VIEPFKKFCYARCTKAESVIAIAAGPSTGRHMKDIAKYAKKNKSLVFAANYHYPGIYSHYTYFTDLQRMRKNSKSVESKVIIVSSFLAGQLTRGANRAKFRHLYSNKKIFMAGKIGGKPKYYHQRFLNMSSKGIFPYTSLGTAGISSITISLLAKPKKILIVGIDGSMDNGKYKVMFNGRREKYGKPEKEVRKRKYLQKCLFPTFIDKGIQIETFEDVHLLGINKEKFGIKII
jgi:hypothetical protein